MPKAFYRLHLAIFLAGLTAIFGKLITLNEGILVWYRMALTALFWSAFLLCSRKFPRVSMKDFLEIALLGVIMALHWVFFYASIKHSNVSIAVVCFALSCFFTVIFEPLINRTRLSPRDLMLSFLTISGIALIFHFDTRYRLGITLGTISSAFYGLFTVVGKRTGKKHPASTLLLYEMIGGAVFLTLLMPLYLNWFTGLAIAPRANDLVLLLLFVLFCTLWLNLLLFQALKDLSSFTVSLSFNLEPIYSIVIAMLVFSEARELGWSFAAGVTFITLSVVLQTWFALSERPDFLRRRA